jgi:hypothetical protein
MALYQGVIRKMPGSGHTEGMKEHHVQLVFERREPLDQDDLVCVLDDLGELLDDLEERYDAVAAGRSGDPTQIEVRYTICDESPGDAVSVSARIVDDILARLNTIEIARRSTASSSQHVLPHGFHLRRMLDDVAA